MEGLVAVTAIAVVGATGYIGRSVCSTARDSGWSVVTCNRSGVVNAWPELSRGSIDAVVNCAGAGMNSQEKLSSVDLLDANLVVPLAAANLALRMGSRLVQIGTAAQQSERLIADSPYVRSKHLASGALRLIAEADGLGVYELKPHIVYGGVDSPGVVNAMVRSIVAGIPFPLRTPNVTRDFIHRDDVARAVVAAIEARAPAWASLEIGTGVGYKLSDVATMIGKLAGASEAWSLDPGPGRPWVEDLVADPRPAMTSLGFSAEIPLRQGLAGMVGDAAGEPIS